MSDRITTHASIINRRRRAYVIAMLSLPLFAAIQFVAYWLRFEGEMTLETWRQIETTVIHVAVVKLFTFAWFRVYQGWSRYVTFYDLVVLTQASAAASLLLVMLAYFMLPTEVIPRSVFLIDFFGTLVAFGGLRAATRFAHELRARFRNNHQQTRALIVGANDSGEMLLRAIRGNQKLGYQIAGFISGDLNVGVERIGGVPIVGGLADLSNVVKRLGIAELLIVADQFSGIEVRRIVQAGREGNAEVKVLPSYEQLLSEKVNLQPRTVSISDLLRRDPVQLNMRAIHQWIDGRVLLVTGSAGSIGSEICRQLLQFQPRQLVLVDRSENGQFFLQRELEGLGVSTDVCVHIADCGDAARMEKLLKTYRPDIIFHAAAYKHVPLMESNPGEAVKNIVLATKRLADLAEQNNVTSFVMISTDKAVNPTSVMGACKRIAEIYVQSLAGRSQCDFVTVRFGNVLDSAGSVVPIFRQQIADGGPVTVTHPDMKRFFMMIPEASQLVIQAGAMGQGGEIFVLHMGEPVKILDLAREMISLSGLEPGRDIEIEFSGVRPGEKLYEELHNRGEQHIRTRHPKIMVANAVAEDFDGTAAAIGRLSEAIECESEVVRSMIDAIVPIRVPTKSLDSSSRRAA